MQRQTCWNLWQIAGVLPLMLVTAALNEAISHAPYELAKNPA
jgi:hypothetical protein